MGIRQPALVITTIAPPTAAVVRFRELLPDWSLIVVGDRRTPASWRVDGAIFLPFDGAPAAAAAEFAELLPFDSYSRKNLGYLKALELRAPVVIETDDDNYPYETFGSDLRRSVRGRPVRQSGWVNVYRAFTDARVWPRGLPLVHTGPSFLEPLPLDEPVEVECPIQQFLADGDPDVDAIYRLIDGRDVTFAGEAILLEPGTYSPFNSQNTVWWPEAYPLLYLPSHVSMRITDIWRGLVATAVANARSWTTAFMPPTVRQIRNAHDLMHDFSDEIQAYLENARILDRLLDGVGPENDVTAGLLRAYEVLYTLELVPRAELDLVHRWVASVERTLADAGVEATA